MSIMSKEVDEFLSLYKTYENLLRTRGTDYRTVEDEQMKQGSNRMTMMRQMRNYLSHSEDPGFIAISDVCLNALRKMVKEESLKGDIVKNHLVTPAKGSVKEGTPLSAVVYRLSLLAVKGQFEIPVYDADTKRLKGIISLERTAYELDRQGNIPLNEKTYGPYGQAFHLVRPDDQTPENTDSQFYCCTKDGGMYSQYMGYLDK